MKNSGNALRPQVTGPLNLKALTLLGLSAQRGRCKNLPLRVLHVLGKAVLLLPTLAFPF